MVFGDAQHRGPSTERQDGDDDVDDDDIGVGADVTFAEASGDEQEDCEEEELLPDDSNTSMRQWMAKQFNMISKGQARQERTFGRLLKLQGEEVKKLATEQTRQATELGELKRELQILSGRVTVTEEVMSRAASTAGAGGGSSTLDGAGRPTSTGENFVPKRVEVKGWLPDSGNYAELRASHGLSAPEAQAWLMKVISVLPEATREMVDTEATSRANGRQLHTKLLIVLTDHPELRNRVWIVRNAVIEAINSHNMLIQSVKPRVVIESPLWRQPLNAAGGKALSYFKKFDGSRTPSRSGTTPCTSTPGFLEVQPGGWPHGQAARAGRSPTALAGAHLGRGRRGDRAGGPAPMRP